MKQIKISPDDAKDRMQALGNLATARFALEQTLKRILEVHGVDPKTPHQFDGDVLTVMEAPDAP